MCMCFIIARMLFHSFSQDGVLYDGAAVDAIHPNSLILQVIFSVLSSLGLVYALACLVFNLTFREKKYASLFNAIAFVIVANILFDFKSGKTREPQTQFPHHLGCSTDVCSCVVFCL